MFKYLLVIVILSGENDKVQFKEFDGKAQCEIVQKSITELGRVPDVIIKTQCVSLGAF